jgi:hypothetical protein
MVACFSDSDCLETYLRVHGPGAHHIAGALAAAGLGSRAAEVSSFVRLAYGHALGDALPGRALGISYVHWPGERPSAVSFHFIARSLLGGDASIRRRLPALMPAGAWDERAYLQITEPIADRAVWTTYHAMLTVTVRPGEALRVGIGLRPTSPDGRGARWDGAIPKES